MTEHLDRLRNTTPPGAGTGNIRNGARAETALTDTTGPVKLDVPRVPAVTFPRSSKSGSGCGCWSGVDEVVLSLYAEGLTTGGMPQSRGRRSAGSTTRLGERSPFSLVPATG